MAEISSSSSPPGTHRSAPGVSICTFVLVKKVNWAPAHCIQHCKCRYLYFFTSRCQCLHFCTSKASKLSKPGVHTACSIADVSICTFVKQVNWVNLACIQYQAAASPSKIAHLALCVDSRKRCCTVFHYRRHCSLHGFVENMKASREES